MTSEHDIDYEALAQEAMRGVVRAVLQRVQKSGLPGEHHFYIAFNTRHPNVVISKRLKEKYPEEMTIVLQHRFWDLLVTEERFEVKLTFDSIPERLEVPFSAVKVFFDPSVPYGLQFDDSELATETARRLTRSQDDDDMRSWSGAGLPGSGPTIATGQAEARLTATDKRREKPAKRSRTASKEAPGAEVDASASADDTASGNAAPASRSRSHLSEVKAAEEAPPAEPAPGNVVSLDRFRKKP